jgi:REP element-mobilizing transposase RayT
VLAALIEVCQHRNWHLFAAHVRTNHVHAVVSGDCKPEPIMNVFKSYASRRLNERSPASRDRNRWARHGSTRYLWSRESIDHAIRYVTEGQGAAMAIFIGDPLPHGRGSVTWSA